MLEATSFARKCTAELNNAELYMLVDLANTCFYKGSVCREEVRKIFFSDGRMENNIAYDKEEGDIIGLFQTKDLPEIESAYFFSASVAPKHRNRDIFSVAADAEISEYRRRGRKYMGARTMNPVVIEALVKKGFLLPEGAEPELLKKAKEMLVSIEGSDLGIRDDFVIPRKWTMRYPNMADIEDCKDEKVRAFIDAHMDIRNGDRLFLIRKI